MKVNDSLKRNVIVISIIWPFIGLLLAIKHYNKFNAKNIILFFCVLYGFTFVVNEKMDGDRYAASLKEDYSVSFEASTFNQSISGLNETATDFFLPLITFLVSRVTDSPQVLFAVFAFILGCFWLSSIKFISDRFSLNQNRLTVFYTILFISLIPIFNINGFRMWTAAWVFIYGALHVIFNNDKRFLLLCLAACTIHFSFITVNVVLLLWVILGNHKWVYLGIALATFAASELDLSVVRSFSEKISPAIERKANTYASDAYAEQVSEMSEKGAWFIELSPLLTKYLMLINILLLFYISLKKELPKQEHNLMCFTLLLLSYANIAVLIPSGGRFMIVYFVFASILSIILNSKYFFKSYYSIYGIISFFVILLSVLIIIRIAFPTINTILFAPGFLIPFGYDLVWPIQDWLF